jgi:hypothetical protein
VAQKFNKTTFPRNSARDNLLPDRSLNEKVGAIWPSTAGPPAFSSNLGEEQDKKKLTPSKRIDILATGTISRFILGYSWAKAVSS